MAITYLTDVGAVDWAAMKAAVGADDFDNGRSPDQLRRSFEASHAACVAYADGVLIGTARALSDGVCNAYIVDVWTRSGFRRRGIARAMLSVLEAKLPGQHVYLFSDDQAAVYLACGYRQRAVGLEKVIGTWLQS
ncbi:MAG: GNAT family N-acetyltransferase [Betaproteobacteria bacterium]